MRASRLAALLLLLQTRGRMTAQALADELEVSVRTVYRDVDSLGSAGVPVYAGRGPAGGYQLLDGYRTRLTGMTADEAGSLVLAGAPGAAAELGSGTVLAAARLKFLAALPPELRGRAARIQERFHLDAPGWFREADQPEPLAAVADAVWNQRPLWMRYQRWDAEVERTVEPLGLVLKGGVWRLAARAEGQDRTYRIARVLDPRVLPGHFERPGDFDLATYWAEWSRQFVSRIHREEAIVRLSPLAFEALSFLFDPAIAASIAESAAEPDADGWRRARIPLESTQFAHYQLLRFGPEVEVLGPPEVRERMVAAVAGLARVYGVGWEQQPSSPALLPSEGEGSAGGGARGG